MLLAYVAIRLNNTRAQSELVRLLPMSNARGSSAGKSPQGQAAALIETGGWSRQGVEAISHGAGRGEREGRVVVGRALRVMEAGSVEESLLSWSIVTL